MMNIAQILRACVVTTAAAMLPLAASAQTTFPIAG